MASSFRFCTPTATRTSSGHLWEIAHNPMFPLDEDGRITLPDEQ